MQKTYRVRLANDTLGFSSAHFITFANGGLESLHGHNFHVTVELEAELDPNGQYVVDFLQLEEMTRSILQPLDHKILLQGESPFLTLCVQEAEPVEETDAIQQWVAGMGNWLAAGNSSQDASELLTQEHELESRLSRTLGLSAMGVSENAESPQDESLQVEVEVRHQHRRWLFPETDCVILPIANTTAEALAEYIANVLLAKLEQADAQPLYRLAVEVEECPGMAGTCVLTVR